MSKTMDARMTNMLDCAKKDSGKFVLSEYAKTVGISLSEAIKIANMLADHYDKTSNANFFREKCRLALQQFPKSKRPKTPREVYGDVKKMTALKMTALSLQPLLHGSIKQELFAPFSREGGLGQAFVSSKCDQIRTKFDMSRTSKPDQRPVATFEIYFATDESTRIITNTSLREARPAYVRFLASETMFAALTPDQEEYHRLDCKLQQSNDGRTWKTVTGTDDEKEAYRKLLEIQASRKPPTDAKTAFEERQECLLSFNVLRGAHLIDENTELAD